LTDGPNPMSNLVHINSAKKGKKMNYVSAH